METVYADTLFLVNFAMDLLALGITGKVLRVRMKRGRATLAAALGGIYGVTAVLLEGNTLIGMGIGLAVAALMCYIALDGLAMRGMAVFIGTDFLLGGGMTALWTLLGKLRGVATDPGRTQAALGGGMPLGWLALAAGLCALCALVADRIGKRRRLCSEPEVVLRFDGREWRGRALVDTGNLLEDPLSGTPVLLLPQSEGEKLFAPPLLPALLSGDPDALAALPRPLARRVRVVPAHTALSFALLLAAAPEEATVEGRPVSVLVALADLPRPLLPPSLSVPTRERRKQ